MFSHLDLSLFLLHWIFLEGWVISFFPMTDFLAVPSLLGSHLLWPLKVSEFLFLNFQCFFLNCFNSLNSLFFKSSCSLHCVTNQGMYDPVPVLDITIYFFLIILLRMTLLCKSILPLILFWIYSAPLWKVIISLTSPK